MKLQPLIKCSLGAIAAVFVVLINTAPANAYSYGEEQDPMVVMFKSAIVAAKNGKWDEVSKLSEKGINMQRGHKFEAGMLAPRFQSAIEAKSISKTALTFANLVFLSVREKLHEDLGDYKNTKARLELARKSYKDVLDGNVKKKDAQRSAAILMQFDGALKSIGNPGLFGATKMEANPAAYKRSVKTIESLIEESFPAFAG
jgi:hypothetical protein